MSNPPETQASNMEAFFTRQRANEGVVLPLATPDGKITEHWLKIRGIDSDAFQLAHADSKREALAIVTAGLEGPERQARIEEGKRRLLASLVIGWSFPMECTPANVMQFLQNAPQIGEEIDHLSSRRQLFYGKSSTTSTPSPSQSLS